MKLTKDFHYKVALMLITPAIVIVAGWILSLFSFNLLTVLMSVKFVVFSIIVYMGVIVTNIIIYRDMNRLNKGIDSLYNQTNDFEERYRQSKGRGISPVMNNNGVTDSVREHNELLSHIKFKYGIDEEGDVDQNHYKGDNWHPDNN